MNNNGLDAISDGERRDVARRLREVDMDDFGSYSEEHEAIETILGCWLGCEHENEPLNERLADLIEPKPERTCHIKLNENRDVGEPPYFCDRCGVQFKDVYMFNWTGDCRKFERCPNCGAKVVGK